MKKGKLPGERRKEGHIGLGKKNHQLRGIWTQARGSKWEAPISFAVRRKRSWRRAIRKKEGKEAIKLIYRAKRGVGSRLRMFTGGGGVLAVAKEKGWQRRPGVPGKNLFNFRERK